MKKRLQFLFITLFYFIGTNISTALAEGLLITTPCHATVVATQGTITIQDLDAPIEIVKVFNDNWETVYECTANCTNPLIVSSLSAGNYHVSVDKYDANWERLCESTLIDVSVTGTTTSSSTAASSNAAPDYCADVSIAGGVGQITVSGANGPWHRIQYKVAGASTYIEACNDNCGDPQVLSGLAPGTYSVKVDEAGAGTTDYCAVEMMVVVTNSSPAVDYCAGVVVMGGEGEIMVMGANAPWHRVEYKLEGASTFTEACSDNCNDPHIISGLGAGDYIVKVDQAGDNTENYCVVQIAAEVTSSAIDYCAGVVVMGGEGEIMVMGANAPWHRIEYKAEGASSYTLACSDNCNDPHIISGLGAGNYIVKVDQSGDDTENYCIKRIVAEVTSPAIDYCAGVVVMGGEGEIMVMGANAPWHRVEYKLEGASTFTEACSDNCNDPHIISGLGAGNYIVKVDQAGDNTENYCVVQIAAEVTSSAIDYCARVVVMGGEGEIMVMGANAPWHRIEYKAEGASTYTLVCSDNCNDPHIISGLGAGNYIVKVDQAGDDTENYCVVQIAAEVTSSAIDYCAGVVVMGGEGEIMVMGANAPWHRIEYKAEGASTYTAVCSDNCNDPHIISGLGAGNYIVKVDQAGDDTENYCVVEIVAEVTSSAVDYCAGVVVMGGEGEIMVMGANGPWHRIEYRAEGGSTYTTVCNDNCNDPHIISGLGAGNYIVKVDQAGDDLANYCVVEIAANVTASSGGGNDGNGIGSGSSPMICAERTVTNTTSCNFGEYGVYLNTFNDNINHFYDIIDGTLVEYDNGTAILTGTLVNKVDTWVRFDLSVQLAGRTQVAGVGSPREHACGRPQHTSSFYYYTNFTGTITGKENAEGALINIENMGPAFQFGYGANVTEKRFPQPFGASGWFQLTVISQPNDFTLHFPADSEGQVGDINITLSDDATAACTGETQAGSRAASFTTFNAYKANRQVDLEWVTNTAHKSAYYSIEKSIDGSNFEELAMIKNEVDTQEATYFRSEDDAPIQGANYYRLKQVYKNGKTLYSEIRKVDFGVDLGAIAAYPNPAQEELYLNLVEFVGQSGTIIISDQYGGIKEEIKLNSIPSEAIKVDLSKYLNGVYLIRTKIDRTKIISTKIIVSRMY